MVLGLDSSSSKWILLYFPVSWLTQFGHGLVTTVVGPTQPYLARSVLSRIIVKPKSESKESQIILLGTDLNIQLPQENILHLNILNKTKY